MRIGQRYIPKDNLYSRNLETGLHENVIGKNLKVLIRPFSMDMSILTGREIHEFIIGLDEETGNRYLCLYE